MNKKVIKLLMLMAYCIPYGYLAIKGDAASGTMIFYGFMIIGFGILCGAAVRSRNTIILIIGNILSFILSYFLTFKNLPSEEWNWYFKPFTPVGLLAIITITRKFYLSIGFKPLECLPELWEEENPCLIMVRYIG